MARDYENDITTTDDGRLTYRGYELVGVGDEVHVMDGKCVEHVCDTLRDAKEWIDEME